MTPTTRQRPRLALVPGPRPDAGARHARGAYVVPALVLHHIATDARCALALDWAAPGGGRGPAFAFPARGRRWRQAQTAAVAHFWTCANANLLREDPGAPGDPDAAVWPLFLADARRVRDGRDLVLYFPGCEVPAAPPLPS